MQKSHLEKAKRLGSVIKISRKNLRLSQTELADLAGVSLNYVSQLEKGKPKIQLDKLLDVLGVLGLELEIKPGNYGLVIGKGLSSE